MTVMKPLFKSLIPLILAFAATMPVALAHDSSAEQELQELLDEFLAGASTDDAAMHDRFWAEDLVYTSSSGERFGKAQIMDGLGDAAPEEDPAGPDYRGEDVEIRVFDDVAVITFRLVANLFGDSTIEYFNTGVFQRRDGAWKAFTWQATLIPEADE